MTYCCFMKNCEHEVQYVCLCLCCKTLCCEFHLEYHLKLRFRTHFFDSILAEPYEWTKTEILKFLSKEKVKKEKLKKIALACFIKNHSMFIEESLREVSFDLAKINDLIEKVSQVSKRDERMHLNLSILISNTERAAFIPEPYRNVMIFFISCQLRNKKWAILNRVNNDLETEQNFRKTCALYENLASDLLFSQVYQEYINAYHKLTSLYHIYFSIHASELFIYNTEKESEDMKTLDFLRPQHWRNSEYEDVIKFPNGDLFFIFSSTLYIIDMSDRVRKMLAPNNCRHIILFNRSIYYFQEKNGGALLWNFDLDKNRWRILTLVSLKDFEICSSIGFNNNIIISRKKYLSLLLYSIDIDSLSEIPYKFGYLSAWKTLINVGKRLYLIYFNNESRVYESDLENAYSWNQIGFKRIDSDLVYFCVYNKGVIYISGMKSNNARNYFKFDLSSKVFIDIDCYRKNLALKQVDDRVEAIKCYGQTFKLDSDLANFSIDRGCELWLLANTLEGSTRVKPWGDFYIKAKALHSIGKNLGAIECFNRAIKFDHELKNGKVYLRIAEILHELRRYPEAIEYCNKKIKLNPQDLKAHFRKGLSFHELGSYRKAIKCYNIAVINASGDQLYEIYLRKGYALYNSGKDKEALECYNKAIEKNPENYLCFFIRANLLNELGKEEEAFEDFNKAYSALNGFMVNDDTELLRVFASLQWSVVDIKDNLKYKQFKEYKRKWQAFLIQYSNLHKRAVESFDGYKPRSIKEKQQIIKEVKEYHLSLINSTSQ